MVIGSSPILPMGHGKVAQLVRARKFAFQTGTFRFIRKTIGQMIRRHQACPVAWGEMRASGGERVMVGCLWEL